MDPPPARPRRQRPALHPGQEAQPSVLESFTGASRFRSNGERIASYLGNSDTFDQAIADFSETYADQNERDYDALVAAEADGRVSVLRGL